MSKTVKAKPQETVAHRWTAPFAGFLLALMNGIPLAWGVFVIPLGERFGWTTAEATLPFTVYMVVSAIGMIPAGRLQDRLNPQKVSAVGAALWFVGYGAAAMIGYFPYLWWLLLVYGVIAGVASSLTYACVAPPARKWYPDKPGTAISFAVMGAGLAPVIFAPLKAQFLIPGYGIEGTFLILAIVVAAVSLFAAAIIKNPPEGWTAPKVTDGKKNKTMQVRQELSPRDLPKKPLFWVIWLTFVFVIAGGLMCIGLIPPYAKKIVDLTVGEAAVAMAIFAGFNGFGRLLAGMLSDRFGVVTVMIGTYIIQAATLLLFTSLATTLFTLYLAAALLGWGFAVALVGFPTIISICFGLRNFGTNNGMVFTALGIGSFSPSAGAWLFDITGSYALAFTSAGVLAVLGLVLCVVLKRKYELA